MAPKIRVGGVTGVYIDEIIMFNLTSLSNVLFIMDGTVVHDDLFHGKQIQMGLLGTSG